MNEALCLKCLASKGQFTDEVAILGKDYSGEEFSLFVSRNFVNCDGDPALGEVPAKLMVHKLDQQGNLVLIKLPGQALSNSSLVTVREDDLEQATNPFGET